MTRLDLVGLDLDQILELDIFGFRLERWDGYL
jgi:hypothetical protein